MVVFEYCLKFYFPNGPYKNWQTVVQEGIPLIYHLSAGITVLGVLKIRSLVQKQFTIHIVIIIYSLYYDVNCVICHNDSASSEAKYPQYSCVCSRYIRSSVDLSMYLCGIYGVSNLVIVLAIWYCMVCIKENILLKYTKLKGATCFKCQKKRINSINI